jgi:hypothetical protein
MRPDFDYRMHPTEIRQAASYNEEGGTAARLQGGAGVATAAARIATVPRTVGTNGPSPAAGAERKRPAAVAQKKPQAKIKPRRASPAKRKARTAKPHKSRRARGRR